MTIKSADQYGEEESTRRFEAALRGARAATPQPMKDIPPKRQDRRGNMPKAPKPITFQLTEDEATEIKRLAGGGLSRCPR